MKTAEQVRTSRSVLEKLIADGSKVEQPGFLEGVLVWLRDKDCPHNDIIPKPATCNICGLGESGIPPGGDA